MVKVPKRLIQTFEFLALALQLLLLPIHYQVVAAMGRKRKKISRGTVNTAVSGGRKVLHPSLWRKVHVDPLTYSELKHVFLPINPLISLLFPTINLYEGEGTSI